MLVHCMKFSLQEVDTILQDLCAGCEERATYAQSKRCGGYGEPDPLTRLQGRQESLELYKA